MSVEICIYQPNIAENVGSMIRTCACFGIKKIHIIMPTGFVLNHKNLKNKSLDYGPEVDIVRHVNARSFFASLDENRRVILLTTKGTVSHTEFNFSNNDILMLGNESYGCPDQVRERVFEQIRVNMPGIAKRSLNVSIAGSIVIGEVFRQLQD